ncbi:phosphoglucomutase (alpha-D-glucose-1,6-bisphosphate-dependent) [Idiomarina sp. HP20-50]|uniref:phosphoglucomutase (alpha-D-glucose-1,6-bisphosphate-dependent) n=1 Tax=Idiomarina sp. HP20-50 TaxID=3070813 RepID=UPI00294B8819|nr:phosphoglucomutase (alpha-D-glucose-1,6-bisphosphate-dependent) [Idiomarina sp. HP20-50]MDV6314939.1 phosphoglucomutase (alpha-D-glucose-1,6-bisphosphate-dependent) [Idiomarina sp. HP20-50]
MANHERAGLLAQPADLTNIAQLTSAYYVYEPDPRKAAEKVSFGTSGHRGSSLKRSFNEAHILAIAQAICAYREEQGITGPIMVAKDTHALSESAYISALDVFIGNGIEVHVQSEHDYTPTPVLSRAVIEWNRDNKAKADGVVITPSHNPPEDGGFKYNPPHGGPADSDVTRIIEKYANALLSSGLVGVNTCESEDVLQHPKLTFVDWRSQYINQLGNCIDMAAIQDAKLTLAVDAMGGSGAKYWQQIAEHYNLSIDVRNAVVDPTFSFMPLDKDGKIRMDCSSPFAMASLLELKENYNLAFGNDPDYDRHGIVTPTHGLLNPNHYLSVAIDYLCKHRDWDKSMAIGKTLVSSAMIDRVVNSNDRPLMEVPVGFKWFAQGLAKQTIAFAGEESAGATLLDRKGNTWTTDKDGIVMALLAAEIAAKTGKNPGQYYDELCQQHGTSYYRRVDTASSADKNARFKDIRAYKVKLPELAGDSVSDISTKAAGNGAQFGGIKVTTENGWFAARPSGTEPVYKVYAESFVSEQHLNDILEQATVWVNDLLSN